MSSGPRHVLPMKSNNYPEQIRDALNKEKDLDLGAGVVSGAPDGHIPAFRPPDVIVSDGDMSDTYVQCLDRMHSNVSCLIFLRPDCSIHIFQHCSSRILIFFRSFKLISIFVHFI